MKDQWVEERDGKRLWSGLSSSVLVKAKQEKTKEVRLK